ncbi:holo-ACP synthase [Marinobacterium arenosum]|uniref:holo-ACP synthase n=1 Tax=Marinobacterium arenosum TaxID=2862496 RepID=UPI001C9413A6|nr:holo-ACP synthase [Marinobacterium arenosum]MBY4676791.1 holo-ACP synthase [Marinobacterium arenosum]
MIAGVGTDIIEIARIAKAIARTPRLPERILTPAELPRYQTSKDQPRFLAKRFAAKEAAAKALGTGIGRGVSWQHLEIGHNGDGQPQLSLSGGAALRAGQLGIRRLHLSYSDEKQLVIAFVVAERGPLNEQD